MLFILFCLHFKDNHIHLVLGLMIEKYYISDKWFDGSWWEVELPEESQLSATYKIFG